MSDPRRQSISHAAGIETRAKLDSRMARESAGNGNHTVHDGTLEASPGMQSNVPRTATARMMRRRQDKHQQDQLSRSDLDGDGYYTNNQGYRDGTDEGAHGTFTGSDKQEGTDSGDSNPHSRHPKGLTASLKSGVATRRPLLQRLRKAFMPTLVGVLLGWWYDATDVLIYRKDSRIKGNLLTFSLLCWLTMLSIFFYLEFIRPIIRKKPTEYVNWEKELLYPIRIATATLVMGVVGTNIALWPVWHLSTFFVLTALAVALINVLGIFF